ncbi:MAG: YigZ family protein [Clostridia bacterium]|nr:YigZ family protein [Clostridia bacterium]
MKFSKTNEIIEKKSKFYGYLLECESEDKIRQALDFLKKEHKKATHICWAGRMKTPFFEKAVDDGEPSGTAGRPILGVMQKKDVQNAAIFIVRYFGGVKLGAGGLVRIYAKVAADLLNG